jgi:hypothetical protein
LTFWQCRYYSAIIISQGPLPILPVLCISADNNDTRKFTVSKEGGRTTAIERFGRGIINVGSVFLYREYSTRRISARGVCVRQRRIDTTRNGNKRWEMSGGDDTLLDVSTSYFFFQKNIFHSHRINDVRKPAETISAKVVADVFYREGSRVS